MNRIAMTSVYLCGLVFIMGTTGCFNMSSLQTAKTLEKGKGRVLIGGGYYTSPEVNDALDTLGADDLKMPYMEVGYRRGFTDAFEAGVKLTLIGTIAVDGKYQLLDNNGLAFAVGLSGGYADIESGTGSSKTKIYEAMVPLYASYDIGDYLALYLSPKYMFRIYGGDGSGSGSLAGVTGGVKLGKNLGLFIESTYMQALGEDFSAIQVNGSLYF